jgi:hypothetical protein
MEQFCNLATGNLYVATRDIGRQSGFDTTTPGMSTHFGPRGDGYSPHALKIWWPRKLHMLEAIAAVDVGQTAATESESSRGTLLHV